MPIKAPRDIVSPMPLFEKPVMPPAQPSARSPAQRSARSAPTMLRADAFSLLGAARQPAPPEQAALARLLARAVAQRGGGSGLANDLYGELSAGSVVPGLGPPRLQRLKKEHETQHLQLRYTIENIEHYRLLLLRTERNWNEYQHMIFLRNELDRLVDPHIATLKRLYADVDNELEPVVALDQAKGAARRALKALFELNSAGQEADATAVTNAYTKNKEELLQRCQREVGQRKAAERADLLLRQAEAAALAIQTQITATGVAPRDDGTAFDFPPNGRWSRTRRDALHTWITLSWKPFRLLPRAALNDSKCFVYHLSKAQLEVLINRLGDEVVTEYRFQGWPSTRTPLTSEVDGLVIPVKLGSMTAIFGAEILIDWIVPNPGHTAQANSLVAAFNFTADEAKFTEFGGILDMARGRITYRYPTGRRLVTRQARDEVITYFHGR